VLLDILDRKAQSVVKYYVCMCTDDGSLNHRNCVAGLRVTDPADLYYRETNKRTDRRNHNHDIQHDLLTDSEQSTQRRYQVSN